MFFRITIRVTELQLWSACSIVITILKRPYILPSCAHWLKKIGCLIYLFFIYLLYHWNNLKRPQHSFSNVVFRWTRDQTRQYGERTVFNLTRQFDLKYKEIALALGLKNVQRKQKINADKLRHYLKTYFLTVSVIDVHFSKRSGKTLANHWLAITITG